ncbi:MAG: gliding motility-associated C-terminal domain-containing protein [Saprospiraceae bacterium]|nr:gliding motility-associated C-terminal domain-containing protein [Saprospiraceae bacterium]
MKYSLFSAFLLLMSNIAFGQLQLSFSTSAPTCDGFTNGTATALPSGGQEPYAYNWSNGQSGQTTLGVGAGTYSVTVTDAANQTITGEVTVTAPAPVLVTISPEGLGCTDVDGVLVAVANGGVSPYNYAWENGTTGATLPVSQQGLYYVTATDANGCSALANYYVKPAAEIVIQFLALNQPSCASSSDGSVTVNIFGNAGPYTWTWQDGSNGTTLSNLAAGNYSITATDVNGCTKAATATLNAPPVLAVEVFPTNIPCANLPNGGAVNAAVSGGVNPYTFLWNTNSNASGLQGISQGTYTVTVTDSKGCTATDDATVTQPPALEASVVSITPACGANNGSATITATGGTPPYMHTWSNGQTGTTATNLAPGQYYVCTFDANHCQFDLWVVIPQAPGLNVTLTLTKAECPGVDNGTATAIVSPPGGNYTYQWNIQGSPQTSQLNGIPANTAVSVTVTDMATGCQGIASGVVGIHNQVEVDVVHTDAACGGAATGTAIATASLGQAPYNYVWTYPNSTQATSDSIGGLAPGLYSVTATDTRGCTAVGVADVMAGGNPVAAFTYVSTDCTAENVATQFTDQSTDAAGTITSWNWVFTWGSNTATSTTQNPIMNFPNSTSGTAELTITTAGGCTATISAPFQVGTPVGIGIQQDTDPGENCNYLPSTIHLLANSDDYTYQWFPDSNITFITPNGQSVLASPEVTTTYLVIVSNGACQDSIPVLVYRAQLPQITVQTSVIITCDSVALLSATATGSAAPIKWFNGTTQIGTGANFTVPATAQTVVYTAVATNEIGCTSSATVSVTGNSIQVDAAISQPVSGCENTPITLQVTNLDPQDTLSYLWTSSSPALVITPQNAAQVTVNGPAGEYTVTVVVSNQFDCSRTFTIPVTLTPGEMLTGAIFADVCNGLQVAFENTSTVQGTWTFGDNTAPSTENDPTHTYAQAGMYTVAFVSNQACVAPFQTQIQVLSESVQATASSTLASCVDSANVQFTAQVSAGASLQWTFSNGSTSTETSPTLTVTQAGTVTGTLIATAANGCADTTAVQAQVDIINESVSETFSFCAPSAVALNPEFNQNYTYTWTAAPADPNLQANNPNPSVSPAAPTMYSVNIVNGACSVSYNALVTPREAAVLELPADQVVCSDNPVTITVQNTNAATIQWSTSPTLFPVLATGPTVEIIPVPNGMYYAEGTNGAGCKALDSILVNNAQIDVLAKSLDRDLCKGFATELTVVNTVPTQQLTYQWTPNLDPISNPMVIPQSDASYEVRISNQFGCKDTLTFNVNVVEVAVAAEVVGPDTICVGQTTRLLATASGNATAYTYSWAPATSLSDSNVADPVAEPTETTDYIVTVLGDGLCPASASVTVYFMETECAEPYIFVPKAFTPNNDDNNDRFIVRGANIKELHFIVWDRWGEKVYETTDISALGWDGTYNGKESTPDSYAWYLEVTCGNGATYVKKGNVTLLK